MRTKIKSAQFCVEFPDALDAKEATKLVTNLYRKERELAKLHHKHRMEYMEKEFMYERAIKLSDDKE